MKGELARLRDFAKTISINEAYARVKGHTIAPEAIARALQDAGIPLLDPCPGEAHSNPYIDNCGLCAPRWGWIERKP